MNKRRILCLVFALLFIVGLFAGCGGNGGSSGTGGGTATPKPSAQNNNTSGGDTEPTAEPDTPGDNLAPGKYAVDAEGWPIDKYEYELPLTTRDVELSFFTLCWTPQYLPDGLMANIPMWIDLQEMTGVNLEFVQVTQNNCTEQFAVLLAADDVPDIVSEGQYRYSGTQEEAIEEGVFANLYDYKEYMPNYIWEILNRKKTNQATYDRVFFKPGKIISFYSLTTGDGTYGWVLRQDLMDELGLGLSDDIGSVDALHNVLTAMKTEYGSSGFWPMALYTTLELDAGKMMSGFNTSITMNLSGGARVIDGQVEMLHMTDDDRDAMTLLSNWYKEGLITPNYNAYANNQDMTDELANGHIGYCYMVASDATDFAANCINPNCLYQPCGRILREKNQTVHYGLATLAVGYGTYCISGTCEELPIAVSWCDYQYSYSGSEFITYGSQGYLWDRNEKGEKYITDWALYHDAGWGWIRMVYAIDGLMEGGLSGCGEQPVNLDTEWGDHFQEVWKNVNYDDAWTWPAGVSFTTEETDEINSLSADIQTYQAEWYTMFLEGEQPMSEWDSYIENMNNMGMARMKEIYQEEYDFYMANRA